MILYHGTSAGRLPLIMKHGLRPRGPKPSNWDVHPSNPSAVYLTNAYAPYYAHCVASKHVRCLVIEVEINPVDLYPDEDFLEQASRKSDAQLHPERGSDVITRTRWYRNNLRGFHEYGMDSLQGLGNAVIFGGVPVENLRRYITIPSNHHSVVWDWDPSICLANYMFLGERYREQSRKLFTGETYPDLEIKSFKQRRQAA